MRDKEKTMGRVAGMRAVVCAAGVWGIAVASGSAPAPDSGTPSSDKRLTIETPAASQRAVSSEEVRRAYEEILRKRREGEVQPAAQQTPRSTPAPRPTLSLAQRLGVQFSKPKPERTAMDEALPRWSPTWRRDRLTPQGRVDEAEAVLDYDWPGLGVSIRLVAEDGFSPPIRVLFTRRGAETAWIAPGFWRVEIDGWRPGDLAPVPLYRLPAWEFEGGCRYTLSFDPDMAADVLEGVEEIRERQAEELAGDEQGRQPKEINLGPLSPVGE
jgi:hypothetical protein